MSSDPIQRACRLHRRALQCRAVGQLDQAEVLGLRALAGLEQAVGLQHPDVANVLNHLGGIQLDRGSYAQAEKFYRRAACIVEKANGQSGSPPEPLTCSSQRQEALTVSDFGFRISDSKVRLLASAAARSTARPDAETALIRLRVQSLDGLATLHRVQGRYAEAEPLFPQALTLAENAFGPDGLEVSSVLNNLAVLYKSGGQYAQAEPLYQRALAIFERALGPKHPNVATCQENYAQLLRRMKRREEAQTLEARARAIRNGVETLSDGELPTIPAIPIFIPAWSKDTSFT